MFRTTTSCKTEESRQNGKGGKARQAQLVRVQEIEAALFDSPCVTISTPPTNIVVEKFMDSSVGSRTVSFGQLGSQTALSTERMDVRNTKVCLGDVTRDTGW
jgi:hypothetical protein